MFEILTDEQVESGRRRVGELRSSDSIEHNIMAILMDVDIGGFGTHEPIAKEKAPAIKALYGGIEYKDEAERNVTFHTAELVAAKARIEELQQSNLDLAERGTRWAKKFHANSEAVRRLCEAAKLADHKLRKWGELTVREMLRAALAQVEAANGTASEAQS